MTDLFDLTGHVSVVTGGGSGIGLGMADGLARAGASVAIIGRGVARLEAAAESLRVHGNPVLALPCDVTDEAAITAAMARVRDEWGSLDSCFANAGVGGRFTPTLETSLAEFRSITAVDLDGVFVTLREAARQMVDAGRGGSLVGVSSLGAFQGMPRQPAYAASKGGVISLIDSMAVELARHGIRANTIAPGWFDTEMTAAGLADERFRSRVLPRVPVRRWGAGDDVAGVAVYLASGASRYHTGDVLRIDGGYLKF
ncbi:SDR family NAD(P)-dependent oxidoreductase [Mycobacterium sp. PSTR-4-N]|uniref:SDR family NAD(P)-dependent oxidoreductase n=1 Tax=Mycobacterium sp. PSTR-4-N TaxID=2917745 RepID=UPI001F14B235|nr:SDR family oxidoreductase [Mycobacterium sp. PSTR-4-N]MCG7597941.1 SDR family oxidoreductase [Mycobacterium sp. PSTR-4-N]